MVRIGGKDNVVELQKEISALKQELKKLIKVRGEIPAFFFSIPFTDDLPIEDFETDVATYKREKEVLTKAWEMIERGDPISDVYEFVRKNAPNMFWDYLDKFGEGLKATNRDFFKWSLYVSIKENKEVDKEIADAEHDLAAARNRDRYNEVSDLIEKLRDKIRYRTKRLKELKAKKEKGVVSGNQ